jgi:hypothetical protein
MSRRFGLCLLALAALCAVPAAAADGPGPYALQGGDGVLSADGSLRYLAFGAGDHTAVEAVETSSGRVRTFGDLIGSWGIPTLSYTTQGEGLSADGKTLVLGQTTYGTPSKFLVLDPRTLRLENWVVLRGSFTFDALSPDGSRLYLIQYTRSKLGDYNHYVVRGYDLNENRLLPGRIADRTQKSWVMQGFPVTRTTSADGRWVYTLYQNPGGYAFIHALDTVRGVAHCVGLPVAGNAQNALYNVVLSLHGKRLAVHWKSGRPWYELDTVTWRVSPAPKGFPWLWLALGVGGACALCAAAALALRRRRHAPLLDGPSLARAA